MDIIEYRGIPEPGSAPRKNKKRADAGRARAQQLKRLQRSFPAAVLDLANAIVTVDRPQNWPDSFPSA
jgi:hypothetical protein